MRFAGFELDEQRAELRAPNGEVARLRPKPFAMLRVFLANAGHAVSKQELMQAVWPNVHVGEDSLYQCIRGIRTALNDDDHLLIRLVSGRGYLFEAEVSHEPAGTPVQTEFEDDGAAKAASPRKAVFQLRLAAAVAGLCVITGLAVAAATLRPGIFPRRPPSVAVTILGAAADPQAALMASNVTEDVLGGLSKIRNIRVLSPQVSSVFRHHRLVHACGRPRYPGARQAAEGRTGLDARGAGDKKGRGAVVDDCFRQHSRRR